MERKKTFSEEIRLHPLVLGDFFATWCGPCQMMPPILKQLSDSMAERVHIVQVDVDQNPLVASVYHVQSIPTLMVFRNGEPVWRQAGVLNATQLQRVLETYEEKPLEKAMD